MKRLLVFAALATVACGHKYQPPYQLWQAPGSEKPWRIVGQVYDTPRPPAIGNMPLVGNVVVPHPWQLLVTIDGNEVIHAGISRPRAGEFLGNYQGRNVAALCTPDTRVMKCDILVENQHAATFIF
jgi:hypothetical protein